jgi:hypothetical protein
MTKELKKVFQYTGRKNGSIGSTNNLISIIATSKEEADKLFYNENEHATFIGVLNEPLINQ